MPTDQDRIYLEQLLAAAQPVLDNLFDLKQAAQASLRGEPVGAVMLSIQALNDLDEAVDAACNYLLRQAEEQRQAGPVQ